MGGGEQRAWLLTREDASVSLAVVTTEKEREKEKVFLVPCQSNIRTGKGLFRCVISLDFGQMEIYRK